MNTSSAPNSPLLGVNMGLDALDHLDASHVSKACGGFATPSENILEKVVLALILTENCIPEAINAVILTEYCNS